MGLAVAGLALADLDAAGLEATDFEAAGLEAAEALPGLVRSILEPYVFSTKKKIPAATGMEVKPPTMISNSDNAITKEELQIIRERMLSIKSFDTYRSSF